MQPSALLIPAIRDGKFVFLPISISQPLDSTPSIFTTTPISPSPLMEGLRNNISALLSKEVAVPATEATIISKEVEENVSTVDVFDIKVHLVRRKGEPYVLEEKISIPDKTYATPEDLIYEINRSVKLRGVRNGKIYMICFDTKKKKLFVYNDHRQPRGSTLTITPINGPCFVLIRQE